MNSNLLLFYRLKLIPVISKYTTMESELCQVISYLKSQLVERDAIIADRDASLVLCNAIIAKQDAELTRESSKIGIEFDRNMSGADTIRAIVSVKFKNHVIHDKVVELCELLLDWESVMNGDIITESKVPANMKHIYGMMGHAKYKEMFYKYFECVSFRLPKYLSTYINIIDSGKFKGFNMKSDNYGTSYYPMAESDIKKIVLDIHNEF